MAKTKTKNEDLESWMQETTQGHSKGRAKSDDWPDKVIEEIKYVLKCNDAGTHKITIKDMIARMETVHGVSATTHDLRHFASSVLKRRSWSQVS